MVKVMYAYPSDRPNRFAQLADRLQADASAMSAFVGYSSGGRKTIRFDLGTRCGPQYLDIQTVRLPGPRSNYAVSSKSDAVNASSAAVASDLPKVPSGVKLLVFADATLDSSWPYQEAGVGGGDLAVQFIRDAPITDEPNGLPGFLDPIGSLHEITHTFGAVDPSAPNATAGRHCTDHLDIMCYNDGTLRPGQTMQTLCPLDAAPLAAPMRGAQYDCGRNDYFSPAPPAGSFLATHPSDNTYLARQMVACAEMPQRCAGQVIPVPDSDGDHITDDVDACPTSSGAEDREGCPPPVNRTFNWTLKTTAGKQIPAVASLTWDQDDTPQLKMSKMRLRGGVGRWKITRCIYRNARRARGDCERLTATVGRSRLLKIGAWTPYCEQGNQVTLTIRVSRVVSRRWRSYAYGELAVGLVPSPRPVAG